MEKIKKTKYSALKAILKRANVYANQVELRSEGDKMVFYAKGDKGEFKEEYQPGDVLRSVKGKAIAKFNLEYLRNFLKTTNKDTEVRLELKGNSVTEAEPLRVSYAVEGMDIVYWLAPYMDG